MSADTIVLKARSGWQVVRWSELREYRDLFYFLVWRDIRVRYAQSVLGVGWAVIQPVFSMLVMTVVFSRMARIESDGAPYALFSFAALVPWTFFSNALIDASASLVNQVNMIKKIYFPRLALPLSAVLGKLVGLGIALLLMGVLMAWYGVAPTRGLLLVPLLVCLLLLVSAGAGLALSALAIRYRDVKHGLVFMVQLLMYASPVVYPASYVPERYRLLYGLNPMAGIIEGFRSALLGTNPMPWDLLLVGLVSGLTMFVVGLLYFQRVERLFADVA